MNWGQGIIAASLALNAFFLRAAWGELREVRKLRERIAVLETKDSEQDRRLGSVEASLSQRWNLPVHE